MTGLDVRIHLDDLPIAVGMLARRGWTSISEGLLLRSVASLEAKAGGVVQLNEWTRSLRESIEQEEAALAEARAEIRVREDAIKRARRALAALDPTQPPVKPPSRTRTRTNAPAQLSEATLDRARRALAEGRCDMRTLRKRANLIPATAIRAVEMLREREEVRRCGADEFELMSAVAEPVDA